MIKMFLNRDLLIATVVGISFLNLSYNIVSPHGYSPVIYSTVALQLILFFSLLYSSIKTNFNIYKTTKQRIIYIIFISIYCFAVFGIYSINIFNSYSESCVRI
jgi:hypothetical protein